MSVALDNSYLLEGSVLDVHRGYPLWFRDGDRRRSSTSVTAWLIDSGEIAGTSVSGTAVVLVATHQPGPGGPEARCLLLVDEEAAPEVVRWVVDAFQGRLGGPLGELAGRAGDQIGYYQVPISYRIDDSRAAVSITDKLKVAVKGRPISRWHPAGSAAPWQHNWIGSPAQVCVRVPEFGMEFELTGARAVRGSFRFRHDGGPSV